HTLTITSLFVLATLLLSACSAVPAQQAEASNPVANPVAEANAQATGAPQLQSQTGDASGLLAAYEGALENVYIQVNPSVVNINVVEQQSTAGLDPGQFPFGGPEGNLPDVPEYSQGLGSGFVWDTEGHIVTNNHVVAGADRIEVTFSDGTTLPATLVGTDSYSDLAVLKVEDAGDLLRPVQVADSSLVKVGGLAIAIGNPYGLDGTMTLGIISALGRSLPATDGNTFGPVYSIPNIIQTDAPINPGNSGGVLVDENGQVVGVTAAIESASSANAGIGFVIPSNIVSKVVPSLIESGSYEHPYLGISGTDLTREMAAAMGLDAAQRGVLVISATEDGPAAKAGLIASEDSTTVGGQNLPVGGDVITAIDGQPINTMDELIAYLNDQTEVGQTVSITVLRDGSEMTLDITLAARPVSTPEPDLTAALPDPGTESGQLPRSGSSWLGILGAELTPEVAQAMDLPEDQQGVLVVQVESGSPADEANLQASDQEITLNGQTVMIGGDIITAVDGIPLTSLDELRSLIQTYEPGSEVTVSLLRDGESIEVAVTFAARPSNIP
ncbi:MAG TPA: PDZ domain-containing protein, partial [Anaerolineales bacterium]|nr:PDZ domain-containing protein [Anaerolineales bacterium]